jgi:hypothetical protein
VFSYNLHETIRFYALIVFETSIQKLQKIYANTNDLRHDISALDDPSRLI